MPLVYFRLKERGGGREKKLKGGSAPFPPSGETLTYVVHFNVHIKGNGQWQAPWGLVFALEIQCLS